MKPTLQNHMTSMLEVRIKWLLTRGSTSIHKWVLEENNTNTMTYHDLATTPGRSRLFPTHLAKSTPAPTGQRVTRGSGTHSKVTKPVNQTMEIRIKKVYTSLVVLIHGFRSVKICEASENFCEP